MQKRESGTPGGAVVSLVDGERMPRTEKKQRPLRERDMGAPGSGWRSRAWPHFVILLVVALLGIWLIPKFGGSRFGDAEQCEGIGFGCTPSQLGDTISVVFVLIAGLVVTALARRFLPKRLAWQVTAGGVALTILLTLLSANGAVVRYGVPALSVEEGKAEAHRILSAMREAAGEASPFSTKALADVPLESMPAPAAVIAAIDEKKPAAPCRDVNHRDTGSTHFTWGARADVLVPAVTVGNYQASDMHPPAEYVAQVDRVAQAFERLDYPLREHVTGPTRWAVSVNKKGPEPLKAGYISGNEYSASVDFGFIPAPKSDEYRLRMSAYVHTPCLRR